MSIYDIRWSQLVMYKASTEAIKEWIPYVVDCDNLTRNWNDASLLAMKPTVNANAISFLSMSNN